MFSSNGNKINGEFQIHNKESWGSIASNGNNYVVTFNVADERKNIYGKIISKDGINISEAFQINTNTLNQKSGSYIASNSENYLCVWQSENQDGSSQGVFGQFISSIGILINSEFQINSYTSGNQSWANIKILPENYEFDYLVTWVSMGTDAGNHTGFYSQRINTDGTFSGTEFQNNKDIFNSFNSSFAYGNDTFLTITEKISIVDGEPDIHGKLINSYILIVSQPTSITSYSGEDSVFNISCIHTDSQIHYQWYKNDQEVGVDCNILALPSIQLSDNDSEIYCYVSDSFEGINSNLGHLIVLPSVKITEQPVSCSVHIDGTAFFNIYAYTEYSDLKYQWYINYTPIGSNSNELQISLVSLSDNDSLIFCNVTNSYHSIQSDSVKLIVLEPSFSLYVFGSEKINEGDIAQYTAHAKYGTAPDFEEYDVTDYVEWSIITESDNFAEISPSGLLTTYIVNEDRYITIRATLTDGEETHWCDFPILIDNLFQISGLSPQPDSVLTSAPVQIEIFFNEEVDNDSINLNTCQLIKAGNDKIFNTSDDTLIPFFHTISSDKRCIILDLSDSLLPNDIYQLRISEITNLNDINVDGEYLGHFPSGEGSSGGIFKTSFTISRQITSLSFNDNDTVTLIWEPFRDNIVYRVESKTDLFEDTWQMIPPVEQFPIQNTSWTGSSWRDENKFYRVVGVVPYIVSVTPSEGTTGTYSLFVEIIGYGTTWEQGSVVISFGDNITINSISVLSSTHISVELRISTTAEIGIRDVIVSTDSSVYIKENAFEIVE